MVVSLKSGERARDLTEAHHDVEIPTGSKAFPHLVYFTRLVDIVAFHPCNEIPGICYLGSQQVPFGSWFWG